MLIVVDQAFHQYRSSSIILQELLHLRWQLLRRMAPYSVDTHRPGQEDEVRVRHPCMRVPIVVKQVLPLLHHSLELVVEDEDLDTDVELRGGGELHGSHAEGGVTVDVDDSFGRCGYFGTDSSWKTEAHGLKFFNSKKRVIGTIRKMFTPSPPEVTIDRGCLHLKC